MKSLSLAALLAATASVEGHYFFDKVIVNGKQVGGNYDYIRRNSNAYNPVFPAEIIDSNELRCNKGAKPGSTKTLTVAAGSKVGFRIGNNEVIEHPGPGFVYMSKAPGAVKDYDGSGEWFKAYEIGISKTANPGNDGSWSAYNKPTIEYTVPAKTPPGEYLVRVEHIGLHEAFKDRAQFYFECAQLNITGDGGGTPNPMVKIPGLYTAKDPGIHYDKWNSPKAGSYIMPGPALWDGN